MRPGLAVAVSLALLAHAAAAGSEDISGDSDDYQAWLSAAPGRADEVSDLNAFLRSKGVGGIVPIKTLLRGDKDRQDRCPGAGFVLPPRRLWPNIVPALRLVRDRVIPAVGPVRVVSVYRSPDLNACARGAPASRHLSFAALDMIAPRQPDGRTVFAKLCRAWKVAGPKSGWGLGAYFDPARPTANRQARFHVDGTAWRSWGFSKKATSSGCKLIAQSGV
jgi:hypothetical protein